MASSRFDRRFHHRFPLSLRDSGSQVRGVEDRLEALGIDVLDGAGRIRRGIGKGIDDRGEFLVRGDGGDRDAAEGLHAEGVAEFGGAIRGGICGNKAEVGEQDVEL